MTFEKDHMWNVLNNRLGNYYESSDENERKLFREWVQNLLNTDKVTVEFTKADGSLRTMICTLSANHGAKYTINENTDTTKQKRVPNEHTQAVWDCDLSAWRSFRWDRLSRISFTIG